jgi:hypothetical protein
VGHKPRPESQVLERFGGFLDAPGHTARQSLVSDLAVRTRMRIERANAAFQGIQHPSFLVGPPLAGLLIASFTPSNVLWIDAATFVVSAGLVAALVPAVAPRLDTVAAELRRAGGYPAELAEGLTSSVATGSSSGCSASGSSAISCRAGQRSCRPWYS